MAARRLMIVMLALLAVSIVVAALAPEPVEDDEPDAEVSAEPAPVAGPRGELVESRIDAGARRPEAVELQVGDQLALTVRSRRADQVAIPALGELRFVGPHAPARFDFLAWEEASYAVRLTDADRLIGRIEVVAPDHERRGGDRRLAGGDEGTRGGSG